MGVLGQSRDQGAAAVAPPMAGPVDKTGFFSNIGAGFRQAVAGPHSTAVGQAISEKNLYDQVIKAVQAEGEQGEDKNSLTNQPVKRPFRNPYVSGPWENLLNPSYNPISSLYAGGDRAEKEQLWGAVQRIRQRKPDFLKQFPNEAALEAYAIQQRQKKVAAAQSITARAGTAGEIGGFIGGMGGSIASLDPENAVGAGFGTAAGRTFARTLIRRSVEGAGANAAAAIVGAPGQVADAQHLGQEMTTGDVVHQVAQSAAIGAVFGAAPVVVPKIGEITGQAAGAVGAKVAEHLPDAIRDPIAAASIRAGTVKDRELLHEWQRLHQPYAAVDTSSPDERAAAHTVLRDAENRETSPLHPDAAVHNENRLSAIAQSLGVDLSATDLPSPAPIQHPTVRASSGPRRSSSYEAALHGAEGTTRNPESTADGHFQFTEGTWLEYAPKVADTSGMSRAQILALRHDLPTAQRAEQIFRADNARYLRDRGVEDSPGNLSLAHFLGKSDAAKVLQAAPDTPIERLVDPKSLAANRKVLEDKSASEVIAWAHKRIGAMVDMPVARADAVGEADLLDPGDYSDVPYGRATFKPDEVQTDAALMQYKSGGDENGVTGKLNDVTAWNPLASSEIMVWEANDGRRIVIDGHQRVGLAKRLAGEGQSIELPAIVLREADGITAAQARLQGALRNINLGTGSLIDNARVLRDVPDAAGVLKGAEHRREIEGLSRLSYEAFGAAINDVVDPRIAAEVGKHAPDPTTHMAMVALLAKERISNPREAAHIVRQAVADGMGTVSEEQLSLLGNEPQQALYVPIARILQAAAKKLREEKRTFKVLTEKAGKIEAEGNVLDKTANASKVVGSDEALTIIDRTAHSAGPVRDALIAAARAELSGSRRGDAVNRFLDDLSGIDLRAAARGASENGALGEPLGEAGSRDAAAASDRLLSERDEPSLFDHAVSARDAAKAFDDPVGDGAKQQSELLEHDLLMDAGEAPRTVKGEVVEESKVGELWRVPEEDLQSILERKQLSDRDALLKALGSEERVRRFNSLDRTMNSLDPRRADEASAQFDREFGNLTPEQERLIYGIGETDAQVDDIKELLRAYSDVIPGDDAGWSAYMAAHAARKVGAEELAKVPSGEGSIQAQAEFIRIGRAYQNLADAGIPAGDIPRRMAEALVEHGHWAPEQASEIIGAFARDMAAMHEQPNAKVTKLLSAPVPTEAAGPAPLFDLPETGFRVTEEGDNPRPLAEIMRDAEDDELAAKALRDCLTPPKVIE